MNWSAIDFDWNQVRAFLATAEEGSLSAAARALGQTQPTVGRQVAALEAHLGVSLFDRVGRGLVLSPVGSRLLEHVRRMGDAAAGLSLAAAGASEEVEGLVRITASELYAAHLLPPVVHALHASHPGITIEIVADNALSDLRRREADIAIRNARPEDPELIARRLKDDEGGIYATPDFIRRHGPFRTPADLKAQHLISLGREIEIATFMNTQGFSIQPDGFAAGSENHIVHWALTCAGLGVGILSARVGEVEPRVQRLLKDYFAPQFPVWLVAAAELRTSPRVRIVFDALAEGFDRPLLPA